MIETDDTPRYRLAVAPETLLASLPELGRFMLIARAEGVVLERLGVAGGARRLDAEVMRIDGEEQDSELDLSLIDSMVTDRSVRMKDRALPRVEMLDRDGELLFSIVSLAGLEAFDPWIAPFEAGAELAEPKPKPVESGEAAPEDDDMSGDPGARLLTRLAESGEAVTIEIRRRGLTQRWSGVIEQVRPVMGYANIIQKTFHLHLQGGAVGDWRPEQLDGRGVLSAIDKDGREMGLFVTPPKGFVYGA